MEPSWQTLEQQSTPTILAVDTATPEATVAVCVGQHAIAERSARVTTHSEGLLDLIDGALREARIDLSRLDLLVCGRGPGSFTGLRIGMATVKGLCLATAKPLCCVPTMVGVAGAVADRHGPATVAAVLLDARRDEVFCGLYRGRQPVGEEAVLPPDRFGGWLAAQQDGARPLLAGDGALRYRSILADWPLADGSCHAVRARYLVHHALERLAAGAGFDDLAAAAPRYLRPADIRRPTNPPPPPPPGIERVLSSVPGRATEDADSEQERRALLERLRQSGLRLDREGRWWHEGQLVEHQRLAAALHRWLDRLEDGRFIVRIDAERFVYVEVEDVPYLVRTLQAPVQAAPAPLLLLLSDGTDEPLDASTLVVDERNDALYCRVKQGRLEARFSRAAQLMLAQWIEEEADGTFVLVRGERRVPIGLRHG